MEKIIQANELTKVYGKANEKQTEALKGISFDIEKGEFIGIMGASGSGKSTLLNILSTLDHPTNGTIRINNNDITKLKGDALADFRSREIGFIFQDFNLLENLTASENIAVPLSLQGVKPKMIQQRIKLVYHPYSRQISSSNLRWAKTTGGSCSSLDHRTNDSFCRRTHGCLRF